LLIVYVTFFWPKNDEPAAGVTTSTSFAYTTTDWNFAFNIFERIDPPATASMTPVRALTEPRVAAFVELVEQAATQTIVFVVFTIYCNQENRLKFVSFHFHSLSLKNETNVCWAWPY
jgi:hypothetical protein